MLAGCAVERGGEEHVTESSVRGRGVACLRSGVRLGLRRMQRRERSRRWMAKDGRNGIAKVARSDLWGLQSYCDALVDEVWMVKVFRVIGFFAPGEGWEMEVLR